MPPFEHDRLAEYGGQCPYCLDYIAKGRSRIRPFAVAMPPNPRHVRYYAERGTWLAKGLELKRVHRRGFGHSRCVVALDKAMPLPADQAMLADEWAHALAEQRRNSIELLERRYGRRAA